jgi:hypothetical protein
VKRALFFVELKEWPANLPSASLSESLAFGSKLAALVNGLNVAADDDDDDDDDESAFDAAAPFDVAAELGGVAGPVDELLIELELEPELELELELEPELDDESESSDESSSLSLDHDRVLLRPLRPEG